MFTCHSETQPTRMEIINARMTGENRLHLIKRHAPPVTSLLYSSRLPRLVRSLLISCFGIVLFSSDSIHAGIYGPLEFGDNRGTVIRKLQQCDLVTQTVQSTFLARTGLNGSFKCKHQLAGLTYHLYFGWNDAGGLNEITLRSDAIDHTRYHTDLQQAWHKANTLFTQTYHAPAQNVKYPSKTDFKGRDILISHVWHKGTNQSILMGPGITKDKCFLAIRFVDRHVEPIRIP